MKEVYNHIATLSQYTQELTVMPSTSQVLKSSQDETLISVAAITLTVQQISISIIRDLE